MSRIGVLTAAAVLGEFTPAQLAVWCEEDVDTVVGLLANAGDLFRRLPPGAGPDSPGEARWRVLDAQVLRHAILAERGAPAGPTPAGPIGAGPTRAGPTGARAAGRDRAPAVRSAVPERATCEGWMARLRMAEETLMGCAEEPSAQGRRVMACSAMNYLRQSLADVLPERRPWWEVDPALVDVAPEHIETGTGTVTRWRLRADLALARLTAAAAAGAEVGERFLLDTAEGLTRPFGSSDVDEAWLGRLTGRFAELALAVARPSVHDTEHTAAPARLLSTLAWGRALSDARGDVRTAVRRLARGLKTAVANRSTAAAEGGGSTCLFQVLDHLPHGLERVNVCALLLEILPRQLGYREEEQVVPGVLVTAVAGPRASRRLRMYADVIEEDLVQSNFTSGSALIGQAAHVVQDLAVTGARMDHTVLERSDRARRGLLALAGVPV
ncbi:MAG TPA: hypothetical protein VFB84_11170 [Micromonosporaceae bacterium]|nr:hypothetical protein [Micromonosporaceae bacterium]